VRPEFDEQKTAYFDKSNWAPAQPL
jgi:hypothetical protein